MIKNIFNMDDIDEKEWSTLFSDKSVEGRNKLQKSGLVHPYTCGNDECRHKTNGAPLLAVESGWLCEHCGYKQKL